MIPVVGALLSNGLNLVANAVLVKGKDYIKQKTGVDMDQASLSAQDLVSLKKFEAENEEELLKLRLDDNKLDLEAIKAYLGDTQDARSREVQINTAPGAHPLSKMAAPILAFATVLLTFVLFAFILFYDIDSLEARKDVVLYILGALSAVTTQIFSYYFGSSQGSANKSVTMEKMMGKKS